jgi:hypothetical protein
VPPTQNVSHLLLSPCRGTRYPLWSTPERLGNTGRVAAATMLRPVNVIKAWSFREQYNRWKDDWWASTKAHRGMRRSLSLLSREDMKCFNLVCEITAASRGILLASSKKVTATISSSQDFDDIAAGCRP